jgi:hypothetical protein
VVIELLPIPCVPIEPPDPHCYRVGDPDRAVAYIRDNEHELNQQPKLEIVRPANGQMFEAPANIRVVVVGRDPDGWISLMELFSGDEKIGEQAIYFIQPPPPGQVQEFVFEWNDVPAGEYVLTARATDSSGESARSESVKTLVKEPGPRIPVVTIVAVDPFACERTSSGEPNTATFKISRTGEAEGDLRVRYSVHGTVENGADYDEIGNTVLIPDGSRSARVVIQPIDDEEPERFETVVLKLEPSPTLGPIEPYRIGWPGRAAALIADNDHDRPHCRRLADGLFHLCVPGWNGFAFRVEGSDDLMTWVHLCTNVATEDRIQFIDPDGSEHPRRYYRIVPEPGFVQED